MKLKTLQHLLDFLNKHMEYLHTFLIIYQTSGGTISHFKDIVTILHLGSFLAGFASYVSLSNRHTNIEPFDIFILDQHCSMAGDGHISYMN